MGYAKLFSSIITSSIWSEDDKTRIMWVTMLAIADATGFVSGSVPGMAKVAGMSLDDADRSIGKLCSPDKWSRTKDHDGRRLLAGDGGWKILNYQRFRDAGRSVERTEYLREKQRERRASKNCQSVNHCQPLSTTVNHCQPLSTSVNPCKPIAEAEAEAEDTTTTTARARARESLPSESEDERQPSHSPDPGICEQQSHGEPQQGPNGDKASNESGLDGIFNPGPSCAIVGQGSDVSEIVQLWNRKAPPAVRVPGDGTPAIDRAVSGCTLRCPPILVDEIKGAIENYGMAVKLPNSQAGEHSLGRFLAGLIGDPRTDTAKYLPGNFNVANFDSTKFARAGPGEKPFDAAETEKRLKSKGLL